MTFLFDGFTFVVAALASALTFVFLAVTTDPQAMDPSGGATIAFTVVYVALFLYTLPFLIARYKQHDQVWVIFALNLSTGWLGLGWIIALVWALKSPSNRVPDTFIP